MTAHTRTVRVYGGIRARTRSDALEEAWRMADRGAPSSRAIERPLRAWVQRLAEWARREVSETRRIGLPPRMVTTRLLAAARSRPRPPGPETWRTLGRPSLTAAIRGELRVLRAAGVSLDLLERRLSPLARLTGGVRADAEPARSGRPSLGSSGLVDVFADGPGLHVLDDWSRVVREHTAGLSDGYVKALVKAIGEAIAKGGEWEDVSDALEAVSDRFALRVRGLARDELAGLTGAVTRELQTQAGITHFRWVNRGDGQVRPTHEAAPTKDVGFGPGVFLWSTGAPGVGLYGEHGHPGLIRNCRCKARPVPPQMLRTGPPRSRLPNAELP